MWRDAAIGTSRALCYLRSKWGNTLTVRLPEDLAEWLDETARKSGVSRGRIIRMELERARDSSERPFLRLAGAVEGPANLSARKGFSRK
jgi:predicted transcriptional regulator